MLPRLLLKSFAASLLLLVLLLPVDAYAAARCAAASTADARDMAMRAAVVLRKAGPVAAFEQFADPDGEFIDHDLYVFVLDMNGVLWFNAVFPGAIGRNLRGSRDSQGRFFIQDAIRIAGTGGEGWIEYEWFSPCTGEIAPKATYVVRVGPLIVAVGAYGVVSL